MKSFLLTVLMGFLMFFCSYSQEWMTSYPLAKRLALSQNKMMLAVWEDAASYTYPVIVEDKKGNKIVVELLKNEGVKKLVWQHFVPVIIKETLYEELSKGLSDKRSFKYMQKFNDDFLKVMDPNGNILNVSSQNDFTDENLSSIIKTYGLNTSFLNPELFNYYENKNFSTSFRLANKYLNATIYLNHFLKKEMINLSDIYMSEARTLLEVSGLENKNALKQKIDLLEIKKMLILGRPRKAFRLLKKYNKDTIDEINKSLFAFVKYTTHTYLKQTDEALAWKDLVLQKDLQRVKYIVK